MATPVVTVHIADVSLRRALRFARRSLTQDAVPGLVHTESANAAPLRQRSPLPATQIPRIVAIGFWDDIDAADAWCEANADAPVRSGMSAVFEPERVHGSWPGLPDGLPRSRATRRDGTFAVLTLGRARPSQFLRFLRTSKPAERDATRSEAMVWGTALARPPFVATLSFWDSAEGLTGYAYSDDSRPHPGAIVADRGKPFHEQSAFVRLRPLRITGTLGGRNSFAAESVPGVAADTTSDNVGGTTR